MNQKKNVFACRALSKETGSLKYQTATCSDKEMQVWNGQAATEALSVIKDTSQV